MTLLFSVPKIPIFCDGVAHKTEARPGESAKVLVLKLRVSPLDKRLAGALLNSRVRDTIFANGSAKPAVELSEVKFRFTVPRQILKVAAAPDTEASIALDQVKVSQISVRIPKDRTDVDFRFTATFGPVGRQELEFVQNWLFSQQFVSFEEAQPGLYDEPEDGKPTPNNDHGERFEFETDGAGRLVEAASHKPRPEPARHAAPRHKDRKRAAHAKQSRRKPRR